jgi:hypothetical protein
MVKSAGMRWLARRDDDRVFRGYAEEERGSQAAQDGGMRHRASGAGH